MAGIHLLDRIIGNEFPSFATDADVRAFEEIPFAIASLPRVPMMRSDWGGPQSRCARHPVPAQC